VASLCALLTVRTDQSYVRDMDRGLALNNADLGAHIARRPLVLFHQVDARDHNAVAIVV
jgi:hypothetical protein